jgi:hypothetical protein
MFGCKEGTESCKMSAIKLEEEGGNLGNNHALEQQASQAYIFACPPGELGRNWTDLLIRQRTRS